MHSASPARRLRLRPWPPASGQCKRRDGRREEGRSSGWLCSTWRPACLIWITREHWLHVGCQVDSSGRARETTDAISVVAGAKLAARRRGHGGGGRRRRVGGVGAWRTALMSDRSGPWSTRGVSGGVCRRTLAPAARRLPTASPGGELAGIASGVTPDFGSLESVRGGLDGAGVELAQLGGEIDDRRKCAIVGRGPRSSSSCEALRSNRRANFDRW